GSPVSVIRSVRRAVKGVAPEASVTDVRSMDSYVDEAFARRRFQTVALTVFSSLAVLLTLVGLYGLLSFVVRLRTAEIGVRIAVGASRNAILRLIVKYGLRLAVTGILAGICLALAMARTMASFLYGVQATDLKTFVLVPALIIVLALAASIAPAWKAARIDPIRVLSQQ
ncbi:MAG TPA: FtsX-like permease family protein, partial [Candidatus Binataceae bacterium]|nr:FtsX-like permease family protein [Candidatus Binataceae bacterium]